MLLYIDDYPYSGMSYCGDLDLPLPPGRIWGPDGKWQIANLLCACKVLEYCMWYWFFYFWYVDTAPVKPARYMGRPTVSGATGSSGSRVQQNEGATALLEDICHRCEMIFTNVLECGWKDLDDQYIEPCIGLPSEWRGVMRCMEMARQGMCDLWFAGAELFSRDPLDSN